MERRQNAERRTEQRDTTDRRRIDRIACNVETIAWLLVFPTNEFAWIADRRRSLAALLESENVALNSEFR